MRHAKRTTGSVWVTLLAPVVVSFLPYQAHALSIYTDAAPQQTTEPGVDATAADDTTDATRARKLAEYIQDTYQVRQEKAKIIVSEAIDSGAEHELEPELILAVIAVESTFKERALSPKGARGLMQILPSAHPETVKKLGGEHVLFDPEKNISAGSGILVHYLSRSRGDLSKALLRYNGSLKDPRSGYARRVLRVYNRLKQASDLG